MSAVNDYRGLRAYQADAARTLGGIDSERDGLALCGLGVAGEAGEVADLLKKHLFHGKPLDRNLLAKELGDVLWYLAACCEVAGLDLGMVASANMEKLAKRYPNGFNHADSATRLDLDCRGCKDGSPHKSDHAGERCTYLPSFRVCNCNRQLYQEHGPECNSRLTDVMA